MDDADHSPSGLRGAKPVIVAEDDPGNRLVLCRMLQRLGRDAIRAVDGVKAVELASQHEADILFMDLNMPKLDGLDAMRAIRAKPDLAALRVFAVTGDVTDQSRLACEAAGFDGFLAKPVEMAELRTILTPADRS